MRILNREEIIRLTGKQTKPAQARILRHMGIDFRIRPDGEIIVVDTDLPLTAVVGRKSKHKEFTIDAT